AGDVVPADERAAVRLDLLGLRAGHHRYRPVHEVQEGDEQDDREPDDQDAADHVEHVGGQGKELWHATTVPPTGDSGNSPFRVDPARICRYRTRSSRSFGACARPALPRSTPSTITTSAVKSFSPRISAEPTPYEST